MKWLDNAKHYLSSWGSDGGWNDNTDPAILRAANAPWSFWQQGLGSKQYGTHPVVITCCNIISDTISEMEFQHQVKNDKGSFDIVRDSRIAKILRRPNPHTTKSVFFKKVIKDMLLSGNGFAHVTRDRSFRINALYTTARLDPLINAEENLVLYSGIANEFLLDVDTVFPERDVLNYISNPGEHILLGESIVTGLARSASVLNSISGQNAAYFGDKRRYGGYVSTDMSLKTEQVTALRARLNDVNDGQMPILTNGLKILSSEGSSNKDSENSVIYQLNVDEILSAFKVPRAIYGDFSDLSFNSSSAIQILFRQGMKHYITSLEEALMKLFDLDETNERILIDMDSLLVPEFKDKIEGLKTLHLNGLMSANEIRTEQLNLPEHKDGSELMMQNQVVALGTSSVERIETKTKKQGLFNV